jgi:selenide,water dikinase
MEDAAFLRPESGPALVFTVDFITPIVDDPETYGAIAAANSLSDVYAMGGEPRVALAICGFPEDRVSTEVIGRIFRGGRDKAAEADCAIVGGHTVIDPELKYGLCVLGTVDPSRVLTHARARVGDVLVLTKPIGTGIASQAIKKERLEERDLRTLVGVLTTLNRGAKDAALAAKAHAATDITGFGLLGHLHNVLLAAKAAARIDARAVPAFEFSRKLVEDGVAPGGTRRNLAYVEPWARFDPSIGEAERLLLCDAQTSGGLLIAVSPERAETLIAELEKRRAPARAVVGEVVAGEAGRIDVVARG